MQVFIVTRDGNEKLDDNWETVPVFLGVHLTQEQAQTEITSRCIPDSPFVAEDFEITPYEVVGGDFVNRAGH